ncbi:hypothetical protein ABK040_007920 [Willaertia magna]
MKKAEELVYKDLNSCQQDALSVLTDKKINKLLMQIKDQNSKGCSMLRRGLDLKMCTDPEELGISGYYSNSQQQIVVCCNQQRGLEDLQNTITHEMVHAYDFCKYRSLFYCKSRACSEVRAYNLAGSCTSDEEIKHFGTKEQCIKAHAYGSTVRSCRTSAKKDIDDIFDVCYGDMTPFKKSPSKGEFKPHELPSHEKVTTN